jgi:hypothetical protein
MYSVRPVARLKENDDSGRLRIKTPHDKVALVTGASRRLNASLVRGALRADF